MNAPTSIEEFEEQYAARSGVTVEQLHAWGRYGALCDCGEEGCEGFQMAHADDDAPAPLPAGVCPVCHDDVYWCKGRHP